MKKLSIILGMVAMVLGFASCKQEDEPRYKAPTTFTVNEPALQDQAFRTSTEMTDKETFNLFCSQPDYGYSAICKYSALVSLNPDAPIEEWIALPNETSNSAQMSIKTFELGVAVLKLLNVEDEADFIARNLYNVPQKVYLKGVCEISGIADSKIISSNCVSYNKVYLNYAEKLPAWIYILGDIENIETGEVNGFLAPSEDNRAVYEANFVLYEPDDMVGEKIFVGSFNLVPKSGATADSTNPDDRAQFRFATDLVGWDDTGNGFLGSGLPDFNNRDITDKWDNEFKGSITANSKNALGNWGALITETTPFTVVVDNNEDDPQVYIKKGVHEVSFMGRTPEFK